MADHCDICLLLVFEAVVPSSLLNMFVLPFCLMKSWYTQLCATQLGATGSMRV